MDEVINPTVAGMAAEGNTYVGFLYAGLMIMADGTPKVVEFNCRFGDPEAQPIMMRLNTDLVALCEKALTGKLHETTIDFDNRACLGVVLAAGGYPGAYSKGDVITGLDADRNNEAVKLFHAGTRENNQSVVTAGGRVLCATALGTTVTQAQALAYELVNQVSWEGMYYRSDIGYRAIAREKS